MITLDLNALAVESFPTTEVAPTQWLIVSIPATDEEDPARLAAYEGAETHERICTTV